MARRIFLIAWLAVIATAAATHAGTKAAPRFHVLGHADPGGGYSGDVVGERHYAYLSSRKGKASDCPSLSALKLNTAMTQPFKKKNGVQTLRLLYTAQVFSPCSRASTVQARRQPFQAADSIPAVV